MSDPSHIEQLTGLACRVWPPLEQRAAGLVILLHGLGGDENAMAVFRPAMPSHLMVVSPRAPFLLTPGGNSWHARISDRAWPIMEDFEESNDRIAALLMDCRDRHQFAGPVLVVGFSQGGAAAVAFAAEHRTLICGLALLAGFVPRPSGNHRLERPLQGLPSFVAFGTRDITIPIDKSTQGIDWLREAGASLTTCDAPIGHKVSAGCLRSLEEWAVLASGAAKSSVRGAAGVV